MGCGVLCSTDLRGLVPITDKTRMIIETDVGSVGYGPNPEIWALVWIARCLN